MNSSYRNGTSIQLAPALTSLGLAALLLIASPSRPFAAGELEAHRESSLTGTVQAKDGTPLEEVVVSLEPLAGSKDAGHATERKEVNGATVINRSGHFMPGLLVLPVGTTVTFRTVDRQFHTAELSSAGRLLSHLVLLPDGPDFAYTFTAPGVIVIRDWMNPARDPAYIVIPETRYVDVSSRQGLFSIRDIQPGSYILRAWHKDLGSRAFVVTVADASETHIAFVLEASQIAESSPARLRISTSTESN